MLNWWEKWGLHPEVCPCDVHFNEWVEAHGIRNKLIYHFGTGTHHVIGRRQAELGTGNVVFAAAIVCSTSLEAEGGRPSSRRRD